MILSTPGKCLVRFWDVKKRQKGFNFRVLQLYLEIDELDASVQSWVSHLGKDWTLLLLLVLIFSLDWSLLWLEFLKPRCHHAEQMTSPWFWQVDLLTHYIWLIMQAQLNNPRFNGRMIIFDKQEMVVVWKKCLENISWAQNILTTSKVPHFRFITSKGPLKCVQENMSSDWQFDFQWTFFSKKLLHLKHR